MIDVTEKTFQAEVIEKSKTTPVVVDFWAAWCGPCRVMSPILEELAAERDDLRVVKVDTDAHQALAAAAHRPARAARAGQGALRALIAPITDSTGESAPEASAWAAWTS